MTMLPTKVRSQFSDWLKGLMDPVDEQSKRKAYELYENSILDNTEVGTIKGLQQILVCVEYDNGLGETKLQKYMFEFREPAERMTDFVKAHCKNLECLL